MAYSFTLVTRSIASTTTGGHNGQAISWSPDGRFLLFSSYSNTVATVDGKPDNTDYYVYDTMTGGIELVTRTAASATTAANGDVTGVYQSSGAAPAFTPDGRILFTDNATNMAGTDTNGHADLFLFNPYDGSINVVGHTYASHTTTSTGGVGLYPQSVSADGHKFLLEASGTATDMTASDTNGLRDLYLYDDQTGNMDLVTHAPGSNTTTATSLSLLGYVFAPDGAHAAFDLQTTQQNIGYISTAYIYDAATHAQLSLSNATYNNTVSRGFSPDGHYLAYEAATITSVGASEAVIRLHNTQTNSDVIVSHVYGSPGTPTTDHVNLGYGSNTWFSPDSHSLLISSAAANLAQNDSNGSSDLFLYDVPTGNIDLITHAYGANTTGANTASSMSIEGYSANSQYLLYSSFSNNIAQTDSNTGYDFFVYDRTTHNNLVVGKAFGSTATTGNKGGDTITHFNWMSPNSKYLMFATDSSNVAASDSNTGYDTFLLNMQTGATQLISHALGAASGTAIGAPLGVASNLQDHFITPFSPDSRYILLVTNNALPFTGNDNSNQGYGDDLFLYDTQTGSLKLITHAAGSPTTTAHGANTEGVFTADSKYVVFTSYANDLVSGDTPNTADVFIYDIAADSVSLVSRTAGGVSANGDTYHPIVSPDGSHIIVYSSASNLNGSNRSSGSGPDLYITSISAPVPNNAPTAVALTNKTTTLAENTSTASHLKVADITVTDDGAGTNTLAVTGADAAAFEIAGNALYIKAGTSLDYETKSSYAVTVTVDDTSVGSTPDASTSYALTLTNVNEAPTAVTLNNKVTTLSENTSTASHVKVADISVTDDGIGTNTLAVTGADAATFEIVGNALYVKAGTTFDYDTKPSYAVTVTVNDTTVGSTPDASTTYSLAVTMPNNAPTAVALTNKTVTLAENTSTATHLKVADISVTDDGAGSNTLALTGADAAYFEIVGNALYIKAGTSLDFESKSSYAVSVTVDDSSVGATPDASTSYALTLTNANDAPAISSNGGGASVSVNVAENGKAVTTVHATDQDGNALAYSLAGGADAAKFSINASTGALAFKAAPDFEHPGDSGANNSYAVKVQVSDGSATDLQTLTVKVTDVKGVTVEGTSKDDKIDSSHPHGSKVPGGEADTLFGKGGDDTIRGYEGADKITGGKGADDMYGGKGDDRDVFVFTSDDDSGTTSKTWDRIFDFDSKSGNEAVSDKIDLSDLKVKWSDIDLDASGSNVKVSIDTHGSSKADMVIQVMDVSALHQADFIL